METQLTAPQQARRRFAGPVLTGKFAGRVGTIGKISTKTIEPKRS